MADCKVLLIMVRRWEVVSVASSCSWISCCGLRDVKWSGAGGRISYSGKGWQVNGEDATWGLDLG